MHITASLMQSRTVLIPEVCPYLKCSSTHCIISKHAVDRNGEGLKWGMEGLKGVWDGGRVWTCEAGVGQWVQHDSPQCLIIPFDQSQLTIPTHKLSCLVKSQPLQIFQLLYWKMNKYDGIDEPVSTITLGPEGGKILAIACSHSKYPCVGRWSSRSLLGFINNIFSISHSHL